MTALPLESPIDVLPVAAEQAPDRLWRRALRSRRAIAGGGMLGLIVLICVITLPFTFMQPVNGLFYNFQDDQLARVEPRLSTVRLWFGTDMQGRSILARCLLGGVISLGIGVAAAAISVVLGVTVGLVAGYRGGWVDSVLMRTVDVLYGLPYVLLLVLFKIALEPPLAEWLESPPAASVVVLFLAIGLVSWLTMARVVRGQVLSLRNQPFVEAARAAGLKERRIFTHHLLPNLVGPIIVYTTLIIPQAILQESFLSFLGIGIQPPLPTWGSLASDALLPALNPVNSRWWLLVFPCILLASTLLSLNFLGDGLRDVLDPKRDAAKL